MIKYYYKDSSRTKNEKRQPLFHITTFGFSQYTMLTLKKPKELILLTRKWTLLNGKIQEVKTVGRGYRKLENFRSAILFFHGGLDLYPRRW